MENIGQNTIIANRILLVKESNEMTGWNDALAKIIREVHGSLEKTWKEVNASDKGIEQISDEQYLTDAEVYHELSK